MSDAPAPVDGRAARAARTREAVVAALVELFEEGQVRPTAREIAARAGVSLRSVYVHFEDVDDLFAAVAARQLEHLRPLLVEIPADGPLRHRVHAFVAARARILEAGAAVRRAAVLAEDSSPRIAELFAIARAAYRDQVARTFAPELARRSATAQRRLLAGLDVAGGATTWDSLRRHQQLPVAVARSVVVEIYRSLLETEP